MSTSSAYASLSAFEHPSTASQAVVYFRGTPQAEVFSRMLNESLAGTLRLNVVRTPTATEVAGFVHSSPPDQPWSGTFWARDAGPFLRELIFWGAEDEMRLVAHALIDLMARREEDLRGYPEYFQRGAAVAGMDGSSTAMIVVALSLLAGRLPVEDALRGKISAFLLGERSPMLYFERQLKHGPLLASSGEFGPGHFIAGKACNVVHNGLVRLAFFAAADVAEASGEVARAESWRAFATTLGGEIVRLLTAPDGGWLWCVSEDSHTPDDVVLNHEINAGSSAILGALCHQADVLGLEPAGEWMGIEQARKTLERLWALPRRRELLEEFGLWLQLDRYLGGSFSTAARGQGYALQTLLLLGDRERTERALHGLAEQSYNQGQTRSPYFLFEQWRVPPVENMAQLGCGELSVLAVAETLKVARLLLGVDDRDPARLRISPRLPADWTEALVERFPVKTNAGILRVNLYIKQTPTGTTTRVVTQEGVPLPFTSGAR